MNTFAHPYAIIAAAGPLFLLGVKACLFCFFALVVGCMFYWVFVFSSPIWYPFVLLGSVIHGYIKGTKQSNDFDKVQDKQRSAQNAQEAHPKESDEPYDPYSILGVAKGSSKEDIAKAYRSLIVKNHPDKVASLDPALLKFATERTKLIHQAYSELSST